MEVLLVKLSIFAGLFGYIGLFGLAALLASVIWLIIRVANFDSILPPLLCVLLSVALAAGGLVLSPTPEVHMEPMRPPWEAPLEAVKGQLGKLKDNGPWARFFKDEDPPDEGLPEDAPEDGSPVDDEGGEAQPELETMEVVRTSDPAEGAEPAVSPEETNPAAEQNGVLVDEVISGWRVRMTLPREWKDLCVVRNDGSYLAFLQKTSVEGYGGELFVLSVAEGQVDPNIPGVEEIVEKEGMILYTRYPTDVQFNYESNEISEEYNRMQAEIPSILETVEFERA